MVATSKYWNKQPITFLGSTTLRGGAICSQQDWMG
ncbi:MAG: hypothetical protein KDC49_06775 [Saprospiraceae bacterium]|nr:hypothetical protein [Saprospiraceae bacterium]